MPDSCEIICLGDIILDTYCDGLVERISPEAPIPILKVKNDKKKDLGGSGNVARNITAAGNKCHLISIVGDDNNGKILKELCKKTKNLTFDLIVDKTRITTKKQRFVSGSQQILRVDSESKEYISSIIERSIFNRFLKKLEHANVVIISDYKKGMLTRSLLKKIIRICRAKKKIVIVDPKDKDFSIYANANIITPNQKELFEATEPNLNVSDYSVDKLSKKIINSKRPLIIFGESFLRIRSAEYLFNLLKDFLKKNEKISSEWNPLNVLSVDAGTVGNLDLDIIDRNNKLLDEVKENKFEIIYLFGQDNLDFKKKDEFIIYQGSHGDRGAEIADIILPGAAYTEQSGHYTNLEGKIQKAYKASYPPGDAKEDWQIINHIAEVMNNRKLFNDKEELESSMFNYLKIKQEQKNSEFIEKIEQKTFENEKIKVEFKDYYFSNVVARASKTMFECNNSKLVLKKTGTEG